jgi:hypothetical protein
MSQRLGPLVLDRAQETRVVLLAIPFHSLPFSRDTDLRVRLFCRRIKFSHYAPPLN